MLLTNWNYHVPIKDYVLETDRLQPGAPSVRLCFLSDLHIGSIRILPDVILTALRAMNCDGVILGGDHFEEDLPDSRAARFIDELIEAAPAPVYAVFGNHDKAPHYALFEEAGITCLEGTRAVLPPANDQGAPLHLYGAAFSQVGWQALKDAPTPDPGAFNILVTHSPDFAPAAREKAFDLFLCGHTHAGQICLPGGYMIIRSASVPRRICAREWILGDMPGYTSPGIGTSVLPIRINCPPEIAMITITPRVKERVSNEENPARSAWQTCASSAN